MGELLARYGYGPGTDTNGRVGFDAAQEQHRLEVSLPALDKWCCLLLVYNITCTYYFHYIALIYITIVHVVHLYFARMECGGSFFGDWLCLGLERKDTCQMNDLNSLRWF